MERNVNGKGNREAATWDLRKTALFCLASRFCKLPESSAAGNQHWSCPESLLLLPWELVLEPLMELLRLVIFASCDIEERVASETNDAWCISTLNRLKEASPLSLKVSLRSMSFFFLYERVDFKLLTSACCVSTIRLYKQNLSRFLVTFVSEENTRTYTMLEDSCKTVGR
ncbi:uncharacterized protein LOC107624233 isoform X2 [Arachis ipaensis]|uniref:uncharacterized protein LOC107624233 isoform X2 n=1 Tax=Arachis ipaensis TaxID=130454 RepID=UPI000A2B828B|nr:uncharacterized protein LOC107624233 isoform X2 [Arachis ipaensis]